jgi:hypothetical protein
MRFTKVVNWDIVPCLPMRAKLCLAGTGVVLVRGAVTGRRHPLDPLADAHSVDGNEWRIAARMLGFRSRSAQVGEF